MPSGRRYAAAVLRASHPLAVLDVFRVPYEIEPAADDGLGRLDTVAGRALVWPRGATVAAVPHEQHLLGEIVLPCRVLDDAAMARLLQGVGGDWHPAEEIRSRNGGRSGSIWREREGGVALPFDPDEALWSLLSERHGGEGGGRPSLKRLAVRGYYRVRPLLPRRLQIAVRRAYSHVQARTIFPRWPLETSLHDLYRTLLETVAGLVGDPVPTIAPWPDGKRWALVLTHDVETAVGYASIGLLRGIEESFGLRSAWNFVPRRDYAVEDAVVRDLLEAGFEVGVHGLHHDGRDLESLDTLRARRPAIREHAERWQAAGHRSPATHRRWEWMPELGFDYDSSYPDTDPYEPQAGGCCSLLPFFIDGLVELPLTLAQDHTLFVILRNRDGSVWRDKTEAIRGLGGMALINTHPDYMLESDRLDVYRGYLDAYAHDPDVWSALPRDVASWWRGRAASRLEPGPAGTWRIVGPAEHQGRIDFVSPS